MKNLLTLIGAIAGGVAAKRYTKRNGGMKAVVLNARRRAAELSRHPVVQRAMTARADRAAKKRAARGRSVG